MGRMVVENDLDGGVGGVEELEKLDEFATAVAFLEFVFGTDAGVAQHRTRQLEEEALDEIEP